MKAEWSEKQNPIAGQAKINCDARTSVFLVVLVLILLDVHLLHGAQQGLLVGLRLLPGSRQLLLHGGHHVVTLHQLALTLLNLALRCDVLGLLQPGRDTRSIHQTQ